MNLLKLSDFVVAEGYGFVVDPHPDRRPDVLGDPPIPDTFGALMCGVRGGERYIACKADSWDHVYDCSHEIVEDRMGWGGHSETLFSLQANLLAKWVKWAAGATL